MIKDVNHIQNNEWINKYVHKKSEKHKHSTVYSKYLLDIFNWSGINFSFSRRSTFLGKLSLFINSGIKSNFLVQNRACLPTLFLYQFRDAEARTDLFFLLLSIGYALQKQPSLLQFCCAARLFLSSAESTNPLNWHIANRYFTALSYPLTIFVRSDFLKLKSLACSRAFGPLFGGDLVAIRYFDMTVCLTM